jgi:hypothetical protein
MYEAAEETAKTYDSASYIKLENALNGLAPIALHSYALNTIRSRGLTLTDKY